MEHDTLDTDRYLRRLGLDRRPPPTLATLADLQLRHIRSIAFETLSTMLRAPVPIDLASLQRKILEDGRGGYCYELNLLFLALLRELGFEARALSGRVVMGGGELSGIARTHLVLLARVDGEDHVVDVGFGGMVPSAPLRLDSDAVQQTPHEPFRLRHADGVHALDALVADDWRPLYIFDLAEQQPVDHVVGNWYVSTHPDSPFLGQLVAARIGEGWRKTLRNGDFAVHRIGVGSERRRLADADAVIAALGEEFGIRVPPDPRVRTMLQGLLAGDVPVA